MILLIPPPSALNPLIKIQDLQSQCQDTFHRLKPKTVNLNQRPAFLENLI